MERPQNHIFGFFIHYPGYKNCGGAGFWIEADCLNNQYDPGVILAHETGHIVADHDRFYGHGNSFSNAGFARYPFSYGYYNKPLTDTAEKRWRDVMAYECLSFGDRARDSALGPPWWPCPAPHPIVPYMSNPEKIYPLTGEPMGTYEYENVALSFNTYKDTISSWQVEPNYLFLQDTLFGKEAGNPEAIDSMTVANFLIKDSGQLNITVGKSVRFQNFEMQGNGSLSVLIGNNPEPLAKASAPPIRSAKKKIPFAFPTEPPQIVRVGREFYLLNNGLSQTTRLACFNIKGRSVFSHALSNLDGKGRYHVPVPQDLSNDLLVFRIENELGVFWSKVGPK